MTKLQRVRETVFGLIALAAGVLLIRWPENAYYWVIGILSIVFSIRGLSAIVYYFTMARFMTGGRSLLYKGVILLDFGLLTGTLTDVPRIYVLLYLVFINGFSGLVEILRAFEAKGYGGSWKLKLFHGIVDLSMALMCIVFIRQQSVAVIIFAAGLIYSAILRIISACRKTKLIYIQ